MESESASFARVSKIENGKNENSTEILDWQYDFPLERNSAKTSFRQFAPVSIENGNWNIEASSKCLSSGQSCGDGNYEVLYEESTTQAKEGDVNYQVKLDLAAPPSNLLNANSDGSSAGSGTGIDTVLAEQNNQNAFASGSADFTVVDLPETFNYWGRLNKIHVNELGFITFIIQIQPLGQMILI